MLQRMQAERDETGGVLNADHPEYSAFLAQLVAVEVQKMIARIHGKACPLLAPVPAGVNGDVTARLQGANRKLSQCFGTIVS